MDPRCSPPWVFLAHPSDEIAQLSIDLWPPCPLPRFPTPERRETRTMPAKDGLRLNDLRRTEQARPAPRHPDQQGPVTAAQLKTRRRTPQGDAELMAEEQVLGLKPARRLEEVNDEHCDRMQEREHCSQSCDDSTRRCDSQAGWDFRKGQDEIYDRDSAAKVDVCYKTLGRRPEATVLIPSPLFLILLWCGLRQIRL
jgi:hypothetical protein